MDYFLPPPTSIPHLPLSSSSSSSSTTSSMISTNTNTHISNSSSSCSTPSSSLPSFSRVPWTLSDLPSFPLDSTSTHSLFLDSEEIWPYPTPPRPSFDSFLFEFQTLPKPYEDPSCFQNPYLSTLPLPPPSSNPTFPSYFFSSTSSSCCSSSSSSSSSLLHEEFVPSLGFDSTLPSFSTFSYNLPLLPPSILPTSTFPTPPEATPHPITTTLPCSSTLPTTTSTTLPFSCSTSNPLLLIPPPPPPPPPSSLLTGGSSSVSSSSSTCSNLTTPTSTSSLFFPPPLVLNASPSPTLKPTPPLPSLTTPTPPLLPPSFSSCPFSSSSTSSSNSPGSSPSFCFTSNLNFQHTQFKKKKKKKKKKKHSVALSFFSSSSSSSSSSPSSFQVPPYPPPSSSSSSSNAASSSLIFSKITPSSPCSNLNGLQSSRLPAYEDLIAEALNEMGGLDGYPPRLIFQYMEKKYANLPPQFRGSATQALKKAWKKGRFTRHERKYKVNPNYSAGPVHGRAKKGRKLEGC